MAAPFINLSYIGQPSTPQGGMVVADQTSGPKAKTLYAYGNLVASSGSWYSYTGTVAVNFIDGVQTFGKTVVLQIQSVTNPVTINGTANQVIYSSVFGDNQVLVGDSVTIAGFTNSGNNGTFTVNVVTSTGIQVTNSSAVAETNPAATLSDVLNAVPVWVNLFYAGNSNDSSTAAANFETGSWVIRPAYDIQGTSFQTYLNTSLGTTGVSVRLGAIIAFSS